MHCLLCDKTDIQSFSIEEKSFGRTHWQYFACDSCDFIFLDPAARMSYSDEKDRYLMHNNDSSDTRYRNFLLQFAEPVTTVLQTRNASEGLDFGSGPEPVLAKILEEKGFIVSLYDPYFAKQDEVLNKRYDFVVCHEVIEHFYDPLKELRTMNRILREQGVMAIRTQMNPGVINFKDWHYRRDPTHVSFFSRKSFLKIAELLQLTEIAGGKDFVILAK